MKTLIEYLADEVHDPRTKTIAAQLETELRPIGTLETFFAAEIVRALCRLESASDISVSDRAKITNEIRRNTAELRRLRADRPKETPQASPEPSPELQNEPDAKVRPYRYTSPAQSNIEVDEPNPEQPVVARNSLCPCRSGKKFKRCCGQGTPPRYNLPPRQPPIRGTAT
jgi:hypothetical protein